MSIFTAGTKPASSVRLRIASNPVHQGRDGTARRTACLLFRLHGPDSDPCLLERQDRSRQQTVSDNTLLTVEYKRREKWETDFPGNVVLVFTIVLRKPYCTRSWQGTLATVSAAPGATRQVPTDIRQTGILGFLSLWPFGSRFSSDSMRGVPC